MHEHCQKYSTFRNSLVNVRALNGVFGKIGVRSSTAVSLSLINAFCTPILLYGVEGFNFTRASYDYIESTFSNVFSKLFNTYDKSVIRECQLHCHVLPMSYSIDKRKINFLCNLSSVCNNVLYTFYNIFGKKELVKLAHTLYLLQVNAA